MKKTIKKKNGKKIINIISGILIVIIVGYLSWILYHVFSSFNSFENLFDNNVNDTKISNAKASFNMRISFVDDEGKIIDDTFCGSTAGIGFDTLGISGSCSFYVEPSVDGSVEISFYEDPEFKTVWTEKSNKYFSAKYEKKYFEEKMISKKNKESTKQIVEVELETTQKKLNTTGVDIEEFIYVKITGKKYNENK